MTEFFAKISIKEIGTCFAVLFAVIDILGSIPILVNIRSRVGFIESEKATVVAGLIMVSFLFFGTKILNFIGIDVESFAVAGAFVIFVIALELILGIQIHRDSSPESASIVPIAFPLIAGAGTMTTLVSLRAEYEMANIIVAILVNCLLVFTVLKSASWLERKLGSSGLDILRKVFGIILLAIAVKLFSENVQQLFK